MPPTVGPATRPAATIVPLSPRAVPRSRSGKTAAVMAMLFAWSIAPPIPANARANVSARTSGESAAARLPIVNTTKPAM